MMKGRVVRRVTLLHGSGADGRRSGFGHDKSLTIRPYANLPADKRPTLFYAGDGVSDLSAARETDLLYAKKGHGMRRIATSTWNCPLTASQISSATA